jgi:pimeloyl-ACP methyl ester carboxylesterase
MPFSYREETKELNELTRKELAGAFIQIPGGATHYELSNPDREDTVVLVHGFSVPYFIFDPTFDFLTASGFRVLRYDLFGRGFSDRPEARYDLEFYVKQLKDLLDALRIVKPVSLVGLSTGGAISAAFTARFPERVARLVLIDPIGADPLPFARLLKLAALPVLGEAILSLAGNGTRFKNLASSFFDPEEVEHFQARYFVAMQYKGFRRGILSSLRNGLINPVPETYKRVHELGRPVLLFWGRNDPTVPFEHSDGLRAIIPNIEFHAIVGCGHIPHYEQPDVVNPILLDFLRR